MEVTYSRDWLFYLMSRKHARVVSMSFSALCFLLVCYTPLTALFYSSWFELVVSVFYALCMLIPVITTTFHFYRDTARFKIMDKNYDKLRTGVLSKPNIGRFVAKIQHSLPCETPKTGWVIFVSEVHVVPTLSFSGYLSPTRDVVFDHCDNLVKDLGDFRKVYNKKK